MLGTHKADPQVPIGVEHLRWKIPTALDAGAIGEIAVLTLQYLNLDLAYEACARNKYS